MTIAPDNWMPASDELAGKTILVTGATGGIGRAVSLACAAAGAEVLLQGRDDAALDALYDEISTLSGNTPGIVPLDLNVQDPTIYD
ncbi:MAG: SDR family NAD(P)-dependent oxidoreductase, partial [Halieaceae bacterium]